MQSLSPSASSLSFRSLEDALVLSEPWSSEPIVLLTARRAWQLRARGRSEPMASGTARWLVQSLGEGDSRRLRDFLRQSGMDIGQPHLLTDAEIRRFVHDRIDDGQLVVVRWRGSEEKKAETPQLRKERHVASQIETLLGGLLKHGGRQHKLIPGTDWAWLKNRNEFEVATQNDADRILKEAARAPTNAKLAPLLEEARPLLSRDWRPPAAPTGLVLLRQKVATRVVRQNNEPPVTPSQMTPGKEKTWIEVELMTDDDTPFVGEVEIRLSSGLVVRRTTNAKGLVRLDDIDVGNCDVTLPDLDASSWAAH